MSLNAQLGVKLDADTRALIDTLATSRGVSACEWARKKLEVAAHTELAELARLANEAASLAGAVR